MLRRQLIQLFFWTVPFAALVACSGSRPGQAPIPENYEDEVAEWKANRVASLSAPTGWLRLAGMFILEEGENTFGSGPEADIVFPDSTLPPVAGIFDHSGKQVQMIAREGVTLYVEEEPVDDMLIYDEEMETVPHITYNQLEWLVIARQDLKAIRLYNKQNEKADRFTGFPHFEIDPVWRREARFIPHPEGTTIPIANVLGQVEEYPSPGRLEFTIGDVLYTLDALEGSERLFIIVGDQTNGEETYGAGRYIYIDYPEQEDQMTILDFNLAYNPPCAFNTFTTCQLPPPQNRLDVPILAGEKIPVEWSGL